MLSLEENNGGGEALFADQTFLSLQNFYAAFLENLLEAASEIKPGFPFFYQGRESPNPGSCFSPLFLWPTAEK